MAIVIKSLIILLISILILIIVFVARGQSHADVLAIMRNNVLVVIQGEEGVVVVINNYICIITINNSTMVDVKIDIEITVKVLVIMGNIQVHY
ncbi:hypothetical protein BGZ74_004123 [Mortierella antarctica]|nr:hypothetical protein BGZ74_004123 [Mortierella antarctica]